MIRLLLLLLLLHLLLLHGDGAANDDVDDLVLRELRQLSERIHNSWTESLNQEREQQRRAGGGPEADQAPREVKDGHYVLCNPRPLPAPRLVAYSSEVCSGMLRLSPETCNSDDFVEVVSGGVSGWATPYALSIYGEPIVPEGAGPNGDGYGDGRAISIAEVLLSGGNGNRSNSSSSSSGGDEGRTGRVGWGRLELQLKGAGRTPFARSGDGRAVLRSSVREFLASEAMHHLGIPTTRALSLVVSRTERVRRPWYTDNLTPQQQRQQQQRHGGDVLQEEHVAITTRAAPNFLRVGTFELYSRRAQAELEGGGNDGGGGGGGGPAMGFRMREFALLARHAFNRLESTPPPPPQSPSPPQSQSPSMEELLWLGHEVARRFAYTSAQWIRVGFVQSNFNSDNCHLEGLTLDYGPFGFLERFDPHFAMWIGSGRHYSFLNQQMAAGKNLDALLKSLLPLLEVAGAALEPPLSSPSSSSPPSSASLSPSEGRAGLAEISQLYASRYAPEALADVFAAKLGLAPLPPAPAASLYDHHRRAGEGSEGGEEERRRARRLAMALWNDLRPLLESSPIDWTIFWRQLVEVAGAATVADTARAAADNNGAGGHGDDKGGASPPSPLSVRLLGLLGESFLRNYSHVNTGLTPDARRECANWAAEGECSRNAAYMLQYCARACDDRQRLVAHDDDDDDDDHDHGHDHGEAGGDTARLRRLPRPLRTAAWQRWLSSWLAAAPDAALMKVANPVFVPREWMLAAAYREAEAAVSSSASAGGGFSEVHRLQQLFRHPYVDDGGGDKQKGAMNKKSYYRAAPAELEQQGGIGFMS